MDLKNVQSSFLTFLSLPFFPFSFFLLPPRNDTMPVNPHRTVPVWQQAVSPVIHICTQDSRPGQIMPEFHPAERSAHLVKNPWQQRPNPEGI